LRHLGSVPDIDALSGDKHRCLTAAKDDGAGLIQQEDIDVPSSFSGPPVHGKHVMLR